MKNKSLLVFGIFVFVLSACSADAMNVLETDVAIEEITDEISEETNSDTTDSSTETETENNNNESSEDPITTGLRTFIFGHSLIVHATNTDETTVPHWMAELAAEADFDYAVSGQYGFLPQHANLPPFAQWGFQSAEGAWDSDNESFADADFNSILLTAGNFVQYQPATIPYDGDNPNNLTPVSATLEIFDWVETQEPGTSIYIYENWPDMAGFLNNGVPASSTEFQNYNEFTLGEFHDWWLAYHESMRTQRADLNVKMIPVGPILATLLTETDLSNIPFSDLYEDDAPHGRPTLYFLASLVTYMAMYGVEAPADFQVPNTVNEIARNNYSSTIEFIWNALEDFNDSDGNSLVFP